jgi:rod shape-determining protein MreD
LCLFVAPMSWIAFFILAYVTLGLQTGLGAFVRIGSAQSTLAEPNFGLLAVVFVSINAERQAALLAGFILGAAQDLATQQPFGLFAFSYGLSAMAVSSAAQVVYREHPLTHFSCTLLAGSITSLVLLPHNRALPHQASTLFAGTLYTALLAPFAIGGLQKLKRLFAFRK